tara:strand:- start:5056 stop:5283 length:228 start_codon:yes stop_codon:yes gene_type:complete
MNKIFERVMDIEDQLNSLIEDLLIEAEHCPTNKDEIEHELIVASRAVGRVYSLNIDNIEGYRDQQEQDREEGLSP